MSTGHIQQQDFAVLPPFATKEQQFVQTALETQLAPETVLRAMRPWVGVAQIPLFRPRFGYNQEAPTIFDVLNLDRGNLYNTNYTGGAWDINAAARNTGPGWL